MVVVVVMAGGRLMVMAVFVVMVTINVRMTIMADAVAGAYLSSSLIVVAIAVGCRTSCCKVARWVSRPVSDVVVVVMFVFVVVCCRLLLR